MPGQLPGIPYIESQKLKLQVVNVSETHQEKRRDTETMETLQYELQTEDVRAFFDFKRQSDGILTMRDVYAFLFPLLLLTVAYSVVSRWEGGFSWIQTILVSVLFLVVAYFMVVYYVRARALTRPGQLAVSIGDQGLWCRNGRIASAYRWSEVESVHATDEHIFVRLGRKNALVLPTRAFDSLDARRQWLSELRRRSNSTPG